MRKAFLFASTALAVASAVLVPGVRAAEAPAAVAAAQDPFAGRPEGMPPTLRLLQANGVKITSLGDQGGLRGFLLEDQSGKMQTIYLTPDGKGMVVGVLQALSQDGTRIQNITTLQFAALRERFEEQRRRVDEQRRAADEARARVEEQQRAAEEARRRADAAAAALSDQQRQIGTFNPDGTSQAPLSLPGLTTGPAPAGAPATAPVRPAPAPAPAPSPAAAPASAAPTAAPRADLRPAESFVSTIPAARFTETVERTPYFRVGAENIPTVYMVADPQCPHCHRAWTQMRPLVESGAIAVKVLLIAGLPGSQPLSRNLISQANPAASWWEGQGSEAGKPIAPGAAEGSEGARRALGHLEANMAFLRSVNGTGTPWMAFVGRDGKVYQSEGSADTEAFLAALREKGK